MKNLKRLIAIARLREEQSEQSKSTLRDISRESLPPYQYLDRLTQPSVEQFTNDSNLVALALYVHDTRKYAN